MQTPSNIYRPQTKFAKVMFLQVCVCPQGGAWSRGGAWSQGGCLLWGVPALGGAWGGAWSRGRRGVDPPPEMATAAGGMHPTGMHSCSIVQILLKCQ